MEASKELRNKFVSKAVRNVQRGYIEDDKSRGLFRPEIKLDIQRSRLMTESFKQRTVRRWCCAAPRLSPMYSKTWGSSSGTGSALWGTRPLNRRGIFHPIDMNWKSPWRLVNSEAGKTLLDDAGREEFKGSAITGRASQSDRH